jgi:hypothetical protein
MLLAGESNNNLPPFAFLARVEPLFFKCEKCEFRAGTHLEASHKEYPEYTHFFIRAFQTGMGLGAEPAQNESGQVIENLPAFLALVPKRRAVQ